MGRIVNVNWADLHKIGEEFLTQAEEMDKLEKDLIEIFESIDSGWTGYDADIYKGKGLSFTKDIKKEKYYLALWHQFLTKTSNKYVDNVQNGVTSINRIEKVFEEEK